MVCIFLYSSLALVITYTFVIYYSWSDYFYLFFHRLQFRIVIVCMLF